MRDAQGSFLTNPSPEVVLGDGQLLIAIGTATQLAALAQEARSAADLAGGVQASVQKRR